MCATDDKKCKACLLVFTISLAVSIGLIVGGFFVPPMGVIDGSVLTAVGELFAFPTLMFGYRAFELGYGVRISHGESSIDVYDGDEKPHHGHFGGRREMEVEE